MIRVADNLQITNPAIAKAVDKMDPEPIGELVKRCEKAGAEAIDINSGPLLKDPEKKICFLVETVQASTDLPLLIDTANPKALEAGLKTSRRPIIINGFSLEPAKLSRILPLAVEYESDIIGYLLNPKGQVPGDGPARLEAAIAIFSEIQKAGLPPDRLIIDPVLVPLSWENGNFQAKEILTVLLQLPELLGFPVKTIVGLSNLTTGRGQREKKRFFEKIYLPMLASAGLNMVLLDIFHQETVRVAQAIEMIISPQVFSWEAIGALD